MNKLGGGSVLTGGIFLIILGLLMQSAIIDFLGWVVLIAGVFVGFLGLIRMFRSK